MEFFTLCSQPPPAVIGCYSTDFLSGWPQFEPAALHLRDARLTARQHMMLACCLLSAGAVSGSRSYFSIPIAFWHFITQNSSSGTAAILFVLIISSVWKSTHCSYYATHERSLQMHAYFQMNMNIGPYCDAIMLTTITCSVCYSVSTEW